MAEHAAQRQTVRHRREGGSARRSGNADLGHDSDIGDAREYVANDILRLSMPIGRGRVEMADSELVGAFQHARRVPLFDAAEQTRATETQLTDRDVPLADASFNETHDHAPLEPVRLSPRAAARRSVNRSVKARAVKVMFASPEVASAEAPAA